MNSCSTCRHFHGAATPIDLTSSGPHGECRRYPPTRNDVVTPQGIGQMSGWPTTRRNFYCGEWAPSVATERNGDAT